MKKLDFSLFSISDAAKFYGVSVVTMRRWHKLGKLMPHSRTLGNHRRYQLNNQSKLRIGYARVSSHDQKKVLAMSWFSSYVSSVVRVSSYIKRSVRKHSSKSYAKMLLR